MSTEVEKTGDDRNAQADGSDDEKHLMKADVGARKIVRRSYKTDQRFFIQTNRGYSSNVRVRGLGKQTCPAFVGKGVPCRTTVPPTTEGDGRRVDILCGCIN